ncbi:MAG TPA: ATP-binding cassette domain-containing protein [Candidatus Sulfotelmatobacter sp.]|jgi:putative ABC transport system ATP-binding protein|nr:ATP-binding cassette domain-containing protein [Candidatus Sulfotelmatobacter sp.]
MSEAVLKLENLSRTYELGKRKVPALQNVNIQVNKGEFVAIMGPSGSGKTTMLNVLGCLDKPTQGKVLLDGVDITQLPEKELYKIRRSKIGFIFQTFNLLPYLNARENVELPMECNRTPKNERSKKAKELLQMVNLSGREEHRPQKLSAGEQQRVAIARALANNPAIILADEPTGNLDAKNKQEIVKLLANLNINQGTTIVMVTHDIHVASHTERMLLLSDGKITKEKQGLHSIKKKQMCPYCHGAIKPDDPVCPSCQKQL